MGQVDTADECKGVSEEMNEEEARAFAKNLLAPRMSVEEILQLNMATMKALSPATLLAKAILARMEATDKVIENASTVERCHTYAKTLDDIEYLCNEHLKKEG